jgi:hypothetical protein
MAKKKHHHHHHHHQHHEDARRDDAERRRSVGESGALRPVGTDGDAPPPRLSRKAYEAALRDLQV